MNYKPDWDKISKCGGYKAVYCPDHPKAWKTGWIHVHRIVMEQKIGRLLAPNEVVHHKDHNKLNNSIDNLELLTKSEHAKEHAKERPAKIAILVCPECKKDFRKAVRNIGWAKLNFCGHSCKGKYYRRLQPRNLRA